VPTALRIRFTDRRELVGVAIGERSKEQGADAAEDCRVDADAECEAEDGGDCERRVLDQRANGEAKILQHGRLSVLERGYV
jgi:hypothetical protein